MAGGIESMKIAVLTLALYVNYGGSLQAFALMTALRDLGHEVWFLNRETRKPSPLEKPFRTLKRWLKKYVIGSVWDVRWGMYDLEVRPSIMRYHGPFINRYLQPQTEEFLSSRRLKEKIRAYRFDGIVVGSDQVWRRDYTLPNRDDYFLGFLAAEDTTTRRVAYAASFGTTEWTFTDRETQRCSDLLRRFDAVSVREDEGVDMCWNRLGVRAEHLVDPTLLLGPDRYSALMPSELQQPVFEGVLVYLLDETGEEGRIAASVADVLRKPLYRVSKPSANSALPLAERVAPPIELWLRGFMDADFVVTDSFHGVVLSILFNKRFLALGNAKRGMSRFQSLLRLFGLEDRLLLSLNEVDIRPFLNQPDWDRINGELKRQRRLAMMFLQDALAA